MTNKWDEYMWQGLDLLIVNLLSSIILLPAQFMFWFFSPSILGIQGLPGVIVAASAAGLLLLLQLITLGWVFELWESQENFSSGHT